MKKVKSQKKMSAQDERLVGMVRVLALLITDYCTWVVLFCYLVKLFFGTG